MTGPGAAPADRPFPGVIVILYLFLGFVFAVVIVLALGARRSGPRQVSDDDLALARPLARMTRGRPKPGWQRLGSATEARGLDLRFGAGDDPQAQAWFLLSDKDPRSGTYLANRMTVPLTLEYREHHVHTGGFVFRVRIRGDEKTHGKSVVISMGISGRGEPYGGSIQNEDSRRPAVGGWVEFDQVEVLKLRENVQ